MNNRFISKHYVENLRCGDMYKHQVLSDNEEALKYWFKFFELGSCGVIICS